MKAHAFKLSATQNSQDIEDVLRSINNTVEMSDRIVKISDQQFRIDLIKKDDRGLWLMDFVKFREGCGPGKAHPDRITKGFSFEDNECFGEETAVLYNPKNKYFIVQYNHYGTRFSVIAEYLSQFNYAHSNSYELTPKFDEETEERYKRKGMFKRLEFTIASKAMSQKDRQNRVPLAEALGFGRSLGGEKIKIAIVAERNKKGSLSVQRVREVVSYLKDLMGYEEKIVERLEVSGKDSEGHPTEVMDFLGQRLGLEYDISPGEDKRLPVEARWDCLKSAHSTWKEQLL